MSFENWLAWFTREHLKKPGLRSDSLPLKNEDILLSSEVVRTDLNSISLNYNKRAQLGLADAAPKGIILETFR